MAFPDATTTGVRSGVTLTNRTSFSTSGDGQVITGIKTDYLFVNHDNVIIRDCEIGSLVVGNAQSNVVTGTVIEYCNLIGAAGGSLNSLDIEGNDTTVRFCDIYGSENGVWLEADRVTIEGNYIHNLFSNTGAFDPHIDGIQIPGFNIGAIQTNDVLIQNNNIDLNNQTASASITMADGLNVDIVGNRLNGGSAVIYFEGQSSQCDVLNNAFYEYTFEYIAGASWEAQRYSGNYDGFTGALLWFNDDPSPPPPPPPPPSGIVGTTGNDVLIGTANPDTIHGLAGNDTIDGRGGADTLFGEEGADRFVFRTVAEASGDKVMDFQRGIDDLDFHLIDARHNRAGDQAFVFDGYDGGQHKNGELWLVETGGVTQVWLDNGPSRFHVDLAGVGLNLTAGDFIL